MYPKADSRARLTHSPVVCGILVAIPATVILFGWYFRIPSLRAPFLVGHPITPAGALLFLLLGLCLATLGHLESNVVLRRLAVVSLVFVFVHAGATLAEYSSGLDLGVDHVVMHSRVMEWWHSPAPPGRYSPAAAIAFAGISLALLFRARRVSNVWLNELFSLFVLALALLGLVGYAYDVHALSGLGQPVWMARNGAVLFGVLAVGSFFLRCERGVAKIVSSREGSGIMARRLIVASAISLSLLGWVSIHAIKGSMLAIETATASFAVAAIIVTVILILATASSLRGMEVAREADRVALHEIAERLQLATDAGELGVWTWDSANDTIFCSELSKKIYGIRESGQSFSYARVCLQIHPDDRNRVLASGLKATTEEYSNEYRVVWPDGTVHWTAIHGRAVPSESGKPRVFGVVWDITERKRSEAALIRSEKLASVGRMAATFAHEVNNPLDAVANLLFLCLHDARLSGETRQYLLTAQDELRRVTQMTQQTLGFSREQTSRTQTELGELLQQVCDLYAARARNRDIRFTTRVSRDSGTVFVNSGEIRQVVSNLVVNAMDAMPKGGVLHLRLSQVGPNVRLTVADTGCGITAQHAHRIFEPFFTTKESTGTGLGLWISHQIIERHGGHIRMRTKPDRGTVFVVSLPAYAGAPTPPELCLEHA